MCACGAHLKVRNATGVPGHPTSDGRKLPTPGESVAQVTSSDRPCGLYSLQVRAYFPQNREQQQQAFRHMHHVV